MKNSLISPRASQWTLGAALALALALTPLAAQAQTYIDLHNFNNTGGPNSFGLGMLAQGRDGNFYAESGGGGTDNGGTIFAVTPRGVVTVIHSLVRNTEGAYPAGGLTLGADGNFYGNATQGGTGVCGGNGCGTVFQVTPSGTLTLLHTFDKRGDGASPTGALILGTDGNAYGATAYPYAVISETIYQITPAGAFSILHTLTSSEGTDGSQLSLGSDGDLYGGAVAGGAMNDGTAFKITLTGIFTVLHNFNPFDGVFPYGGMVQAGNGEFYGAADAGGGTFGDQGTIYSLTSSGAFKRLHVMNGTTDGRGPIGQLLLASDGNLYGTALVGGIGNCGTIFEITPVGTFSVMHTFDDTHGCNPYEQIIQGTNGLLYGLANAGGAYDSGAFYHLDLHLPAFAGLVTPAGQQGAQLGILGQGFSGSSVVKFDGLPATSITLEGSTFISAVIPPGALTGHVTVDTGATTLRSIQAFKISPTLASFTPTSGPVGTPVTITGTGLTQTAKVAFNGTFATFTVNSDTQVTATVPAGATTGEIVLTTIGGRARNTTIFTVN